MPPHNPHPASYVIPSLEWEGRQMEWSPCPCRRAFYAVARYHLAVPAVALQYLLRILVDETMATSALPIQRPLRYLLMQYFGLTEPSVRVSYQWATEPVPCHPKMQSFLQVLM